MFMLSGGIRGVMIITVAAHSLRRFKSSGPSTDQACYGPIATTGLGGSRLPARLNMTNPNLPAPAGAGPSSGEPVSHTSHRGGIKLSKGQQELYSAMLSGVTCSYMPYMGWFNPSSYYYRSDTHKRCTATATALLKKGLVEIFDRDPRLGHSLRAITPNQRGKG